MAQSICDTTRVFSLMSRMELRHPHVMGQIMLLSRVTSHELSVSIPGGGFSLGSSMRSSRLVWARRVDFFDRSCWLSSSLLCPSLSWLSSSLLRPSLSLPGWGGVLSLLPENSDQFHLPDFTCRSEDLRDFSGLLPDVQQGVVASARDGADHVPISCHFT